MFLINYGMQNLHIFFLSRHFKNIYFYLIKSQYNAVFWLKNTKNKDIYFIGIQFILCLHFAKWYLNDLKTLYLKEYLYHKDVSPPKET